MELTARQHQLARRQVISTFVERLKANGEMKATDCPLQHHFAPGAYGRVMALPAGAVIAGKIHKHAHLNVVAQGDVSVFTEQDGWMDLKGPFTFVSHPYTQRIVKVHTPTYWVTFHVTDKTDLAEIEREIIATEYDEEIYE